MAYSVNTSNRISGLASGMDTETMVKDLMAAERLPLDKLEQDKTWMEWQRDSFRDVNKSFFDLDSKVLDMKLERTYNSKTTTSSQSGAVTAVATASASSGSYNIEVDELATSAINVSQNGISGEEKINPNGKLSEQTFADPNFSTSGSFTISYFDEEGEEVPVSISYGPDDSLNSILKKIGTETGNEIRASYDIQSDRVFLERTKSGDFNTSEAADKYYGAEIVFGEPDGSSSFLETLGLQMTDDNDSTVLAESGGTDAAFKYNGIELTSKTNSYTLNDISFQFNSKTNGTPAYVSVTNDVDASFDKIMDFVNKYNETIEKVNASLTEERFRDFKPLTQAQKDEMSEDEIEKWEEKARSGTLKGESILSSGLNSMRQGWYGTVENDGNFTHLSQIGITTSSNYLERGKLEVNEDELKKALQDDPGSVHKLFSNNVEGSGRGIINRLEDSMNATMKNIESRAGKTTSTLQQYTIGRNLDNIDDRISAFEDRLRRTEDRYWRQFTEMEKAIQQMNNQSNYLMQQFSF
ncbi:flagellar hook-associated protein 2 [Aquibacillus koreensis]|uniref:Flagellar hook-associated protein 2 n=1 Tax=Aquibacillus koreensis TaxID=279446 RepID=A0A9X3WNV5_9BACI|nr:flagellar hook-associated protein 2 [Aquibacillus koreensis]MCT2537264.1 flagellar hook-associated protein 2 [Aquibacillus koreensis]MDC3421611.1 flagellar hook-associated protein 2 [Aquibacillus koreensis]